MRCTCEVTQYVDKCYIGIMPDNKDEKIILHEIPNVKYVTEKVDENE